MIAIDFFLVLKSIVKIIPLKSNSCQKTVLELTSNNINASSIYIRPSDIGYVIKIAIIPTLATKRTLFSGFSQFALILVKYRFIGCFPFGKPKILGNMIKNNGIKLRLNKITPPNISIL